MERGSRSPPVSIAPPSSPVTPFAGSPVLSDDGSRFYVCSQEGCSRKYKTAAKLVKHCTQVHRIVISESPLEAIVCPKKEPKQTKRSLEREKSANMQKLILQDNFEAAKCKLTLE
jgi:hypothetical protein